MTNTPHPPEFTKMIEAMLPSLIHRLLSSGKITTDQVENPEEIFRIINENADTLFAEFQYIEIIHEEFIDAAKDAFDRGKLEIGVVLLASAIEQIINTFYRNCLESKGMFEDREITEIIQANNYASKIGWLLTLVGNWELDDDFKKQIRALMDLRNQIVHYKAMPITVTNKDRDTANPLRKQLESIDFDKWLTLPKELLETFEEAQEYNYRLSNPEFLAAKKAVENYIHEASDKDLSTQRDSKQHEGRDS